jgi:NADH-quinone oxidoreductase subunit L
MVTLGVYLLLRLEWLFALTPDVLLIVAWIGAFTALLAAVLACVQDDIKRVLAYSTVSQLGYMMTAIGAGFATAGFFHLLTHGIFKALLFLGAGAVIHAVHSNDLQHMGGLARRMPQTTIVFLVGTLSLAGIPLFGGFLSKEEILGGVWAAGLAGPFALLMLVAFLTAFYMFRVVFLAFFGGLKASGYQTAHTSGADLHGPRDHSHDVGASRDHRHVPHDPPISMALPLWILAFLSVAVGLYFMVAGPALPFGAGEPEFEAPGWLMPSAVGVAVAGILLAWLTYQRRTINAASLAGAFAPIRYAALRKFWLDDLFEALYGSVLLAFSRLIGWFDRYIVDGVLNVLSAWTLTSGDDLRTMQSGRAQDYVYGVAVGLVVLLLWVRWA